MSLSNICHRHFLLDHPDKCQDLEQDDHRFWQCPATPYLSPTLWRPGHGMALFKTLQRLLITFWITSKLHSRQGPPWSGQSYLFLLLCLSLLILSNVELSMALTALSQSMLFPLSQITAINPHILTTAILDKSCSLWIILFPWCLFMETVVLTFFGPHLAHK